MSRALDPDRPRQPWEPRPELCEDCGAPLESGGWHGPRASVCRGCQNKRYEAKIAGTAEGVRRKRRKALQSKKRRLESRIERDRAELTAVLLELGAEAAREARP